jgi:hypothetical protein
LLASQLPVVAAQDEKPCHDDEKQVTDGRGGYKCVPKPEEEEFVVWPALDCVRDFKVTDKTELVAPVGWNRKPDLSKARLEGFEFRLVCGTAK